MWIRFEALNMLTGPYAEQYDASMQATYAPRDPVTEFLRGRITCRQLRVLGEGLPENSALVRARRGHAWTDLHYLVAAAVNDIRLGRAEAVAISGNKAGKPTLIEPPVDAVDPETEAEQAQQEAQRADFEAVTLTALFPNE